MARPCVPVTGATAGFLRSVETGPFPFPFIHYIAGHEQHRVETRLAGERSVHS